MPREKLEEMVYRAAIEIRSLSEHAEPNSFFIASLGGLPSGALLAAAGFLIGAAIR